MLDAIQEGRKISTDGRVSFKHTGQHDSWVGFLVSAVGQDVRTDALKQQIVRATLFSSDLRQGFNERDFRNIFHRVRAKIESESMRIYKVVFPLWNAPAFLSGVRRIDDVTLNFSPARSTRLYRSIDRARTSQQEDLSYREFFTSQKLKEIRRCSLCFAHVRASGMTDANERASQAVYEVLGLVNMAKDYRRYWRHSSRVAGKLPVSEVLIAPHTTVHEENGELSNDAFWYENWVGGPTASTIQKENTQAWAARFERLSCGVSESNWKGQAKDAAVRYYVAFSNPNLEESFLDGWRLFENTSGKRLDSVESKIVRASRVFNQYTDFRIIGKHLAARRNYISHGHRIKADDEESLAFQMLQFIIPYLERFILNGFRFSSVEQFWEFLDLPDSREARLAERGRLRNRLFLLEKAAEFRGETY